MGGGQSYIPPTIKPDDKPTEVKKYVSIVRNDGAVLLEPKREKVVFKSKDVTVNPQALTAEALTTFIPTKGETNAYHNIAEQYFNAPNRHTRTIKNNIFNITLGNNINTNSSYNASGNIKFMCYLPKSSTSFPNYSNLILNTPSNSEAKHDVLMRILTSFVTNPDFITEYYYTNELKSDNNIPLINLKSSLQSPNLCWNWNVGRNYTPDIVNSISNYYLHKLNELIDYIITNDTCTVDSEFSKRFIALFANTKGEIYSHANSTLLLPSVVNWISAIKGGTNHALSLCGYVKAGSQIFPIRDGEVWEDVVKWNDRSDNHVNPIVNVPANINSLITHSTYNFPLISSNQNPKVIATPSITDANAINNVNISFTTDNYTHNTHLEQLKGLKYATQAVGKREPGVAEYVTRNEILKIPAIPMDYNAIFKVGTLTIKNADATESERRRKKTGWQVWCNHYGEESHLIYRDVDVNYYKGRHDQFFKNIYDHIIKNPNLIFTNSKIPETRAAPLEKIRVLSIEIISADDVIDTGYCPAEIYDLRMVRDQPVLTGHDSDAFCKDVYRHMPKKDEKSDIYGQHMDPKIKRIEKNDKYNVTNVEVMVRYDILTESVIRYSGSVSFAIAEDPNDATPKRSENAICLYQTNMDLYLFNNNTFNHWHSIISNTENQQIILYHIRQYINQHPELVLLNRINNTIGSYVRSINTSSLMVNVPFGPPLLTIPSSYIVNYRNYYPSFKILNDIDPSHSTYRMNTETCTIINSVKCENTSNYLDMVFNSMITGSMFNGMAYDADNVIMILLPSKGYHLFEVIGKSVISMLPSKIITSIGSCTDSSSLLYNFDITKIVLSFKDFSSDEKLKGLSSAYTKLCVVSTPFYSIDYGNANDDIFVIMNSLSADSEAYGNNNLHVYISSDSTQEMIASLKNDRVDKNNIKSMYINVQYNGINTLATPVCLQLKK